MSLPTDHLTTPSTSDSYDAHMIPAETAARKDREGDDYKQVPSNPENSDSIDKTGGYTVDQEGLANNYATEPEMYFEKPGDVREPSNNTSTTDRYIIADLFPSPSAAESIVVKMKKAGLDTHKISIIGKNYQDTENVKGALNWQELRQTGGLAANLLEMGISNGEALKYETEIESGKFVVLVMGSDEDIAQANQIFHAIGHKTVEETAK